MPKKLSSQSPVKKRQAPKARGVIPLPETDIHGRDLVGEAASLNLPVESVEPDPNQARWVLPFELRERFLSGKITAAQALERWRKFVDHLVALAAKSGRTPADVPEARKLGEIEALAKSIRSGGQVNPITVVRQGEKWRIETGERRFWAHVWLVSVEGAEGGGQIPAVVTPRVDPFRQAVENLHAAPLNAVGLAREIARLLMATDANPAPGQDSPAVLDLAAYREIARRRVPHRGWRRIEEAMGKTADHLARHLRLLLLPDEALLLADRNDLTEKQLRPVMEMEDAETQTRIARLAVDLSLPSGEIEWLCRQPDLDKAERELRARLAGKESEKAPRAKFAPEHILYTRVVSLGRLIQSVEKGGQRPAQALAQQYLADKGEAADDELRGLIDLLEAAVAELSRARGELAADTIPAPGQESDDPGPEDIPESDGQP